MNMNIVFEYRSGDEGGQCNDYCRRGQVPWICLSRLPICLLPSSSCTLFSMRNSAVVTQFCGPVTVTILFLVPGL